MRSSFDTGPAQNSTVEGPAARGRGEGPAAVFA